MKLIVIVTHSGKGLTKKAQKKIIDRLYGDTNERDFEIRMGYDYNHKCNLPDNIDFLVIKSPDTAYFLEGGPKLYQLISEMKESEPVYDYFIRLIKED